MAQEYPFFLRSIRFVFPLLDRFFPKLAGKWAVSLFLTPMRFGFTAKEREFMANQHLQQESQQVGKKEITVYRMGNGPEVVCVHGWAGRALQFRMIADALAANGFTFVSFDAWAHGQSKGKRATLFDFAEGLDAILKRCERPVGVIGHSLGAAATSFLISGGARVPAFIAMGAPVVAQDVLDRFCSIINAGKAVQASIREYAVGRFGYEFDEVAMEHTFKGVDCPVLAIHGEKDRDAPVAHLNVLKAIRPDIDTYTVPGAGHRGILKDGKTIETLVQWLKDTHRPPLT